MQAPIIVLNGASSSGKSSIAAELVKQLHVRARTVSYDRPQTLVARSPIVVMRQARSVLRAVAFDARAVLVASGPAAAFAAARALSEDDTIAVVDVVILRPETAALMADMLGSTRFVVGVRCSVEELRRREATRPTRRGLAGRQAAEVHAHVPYDLEVDTERESSERCAANIVAALGGQ